MGTFLHALSAVFIIFCLMGVGILLSALGWVSDQVKKFVSRYVINVGVPLNTIVGLLNHLSHDDIQKFGIYLLVPTATILISLVISVGAAKMLKLPRKRSGVFIALSFLSNTLFIGLPMGTQLFGDQSIPYVMIYYMVSTIFTQTVAILLVEHAGKEPDSGTSAVPKGQRIRGFLKDVFLKPPILAIIIAYILLLTGVRPPEMFMTFAGYFSSTVTPMALMYCGFIIHGIGLRNIRFYKGTPFILIIRLILAPAICFGLCHLIGITGLARGVFIMQAALPSVSMITVFAGAYGADEQYSAVGFALTTIGIFITIPLIMVLIG